MPTPSADRTCELDGSAYRLVLKSHKFTSNILRYDRNMVDCDVELFTGPRFC